MHWPEQLAEIVDALRVISEQAPLPSVIDIRRAMQRDQPEAPTDDLKFFKDVKSCPPAAVSAVEPGSA